MTAVTIPSDLTALTVSSNVTTVTVSSALTAVTASSDLTPLTIRRGLARAAVSGDEVALDMFSSWRPKTSSTRFLVARQENLNVFVGSASGQSLGAERVSVCVALLCCSG